MTMYDEQAIGEGITCLGIRLDLIDEKVLSFSQSNSVTEAERNVMRAEGHPRVNEEFFLNMGR